MAINFPQVIKVQKNCVQTLIEMRRKYSDGFWRSRPDKDNKSQPSYTCTAIAIQALVEAGELARAQQVATRILPIMFPDTGFRPLPAESNPSKTHILNNSWTVFALLECIPLEFQKIWPAVKWIIDAQDNGWWNLIPGDPTDRTYCPIFCAHALAAITQFYEKANSLDGLDQQQREMIAACTERGFSTLLECRAEIGKEQNLLLWPQKIGGFESRLSFGVSTMCAHVLEKAGRVLKRPEWLMHVPQTFEVLGSGLRQMNGSVEISIQGQRLQVWDTIHESSLNYPHSVFAPINLVTVLRYLSESTNTTNIQYYSLVDYFTNWILDNTAGTDGKGGVLGSPSMNASPIWSTAAAVITLSRVIKHQELITRLESHLRKKEGSKMNAERKENTAKVDEGDETLQADPITTSQSSNSSGWVHSFSPLSLLNKAIKAVPAVKFALGLAGVAAAGALIAGATSGYTIATPIVVGLVLLGMIALILVSIIAGAAVSKSAFIAGQVVLWAVTASIVIGLALTISALAIGVPCHWTAIVTQHPACGG